VKFWKAFFVDNLETKKLCSKKATRNAFAFAKFQPCADTPWISLPVRRKSALTNASGASGTACGVEFRGRVMPTDQRGPSTLVRLEIPEERLQEDTRLFKEKAIEMGASLAEVIPADWAQIDERVRLKCSVPLCPNYGKSLFCPPHTPSPEFMKKALSRYHHAVLFALQIIPVEHFSVRSTQRHAAADWSRRCFEIAGTLETLAFGNGYYLAMGFTQGSCRRALCGQDQCLALAGGTCPYPLKARPSMESVGIDVYGLVTRVGWRIYPIYRSVNPAEVPSALSVGIVFVH